LQQPERSEKKIPDFDLKTLISLSLPFQMVADFLEPPNLISEPRRKSKSMDWFWLRPILIVSVFAVLFLLLTDSRNDVRVEIEI
jgi:hypothetical protein